MSGSKASFQKIGMNFLTGAEHLFTAENYHLAYYLCGYSIEFEIKAYLCSQNRADSFPPKDTKKTHYSHDFDVLLKTAGLRPILDTAKDSSEQLNKAYLVVKDWSPDVRYDETSISKEKAKDFLESAKEFIKWLQTNF